MPCKSFHTPGIFLDNIKLGFYSRAKTEQCILVKWKENKPWFSKCTTINLTSKASIVFSHSNHLSKPVQLQVFGACLYQPCTCKYKNLALSSLPNSSSSVRLYLTVSAYSYFKSLLHISQTYLGLHWLGHSNAWKFFDLNQSVKTLAVCLRSLSCWNMNVQSKVFCSL